ncbi:STAS domain-containing protein [Saccharothrix syringae]|uniref:Anti-sigma factor antagonist n=1 Tax=Saccharothrix syringae TaxID=103733 RepID=A0A5Q0GZ21_SACSY|nr:STAS domain-containing protein [Saccharothrix syringae]QFZ18915.1 anti-sigma factor antagonist [Saccharothrix syringae]
MLELTTAVDGTAHTVALTGELDHRTAPRLHAALDGLRLAAGDRLVLDLTGLTFCDSSGLSAFIAAHELSSGAVELVAPPAMVVRMLHVTGLTEIFTVHDADRGRLTR